MSDLPPGPVRYGDLGPRLASGLALSAVATLYVWMGGAWAAVLVAAALVLMLWEFHRMVTGDARRTAPALVALAATGTAAVAATAWSGLAAGLACLAVGGAVVIALGRHWADWLVAGLTYMGVTMCALIALRAREPDGVLLILWLVLVVVAADVGAYFVGRRYGGPKLWPRVSPGKTWSGAVGGLAFAAAAGAAFGLAVGWSPMRLAAFSVAIGLASQLGDLLESAVKRHFGVKDASRLIPGHGGVLDRLDGLMGATWLFLVCDGLGIARLGG